MLLFIIVVILIYRLKLHMHGTYVASFQQLTFGPALKMNGPHRTGNPITCVLTTYHVKLPKSTELKKDLEGGNLESLSPTLIDYYLS